MSRAFFLILIALILLVACTAAPTATPAPTNTPLPTATPQPTSTPPPTSTATATPTGTATPTSTPQTSKILGTLYWELNPDGKKDIASFAYPAFIEQVYYHLLTFFPDLKANGEDIVTVKEPALPGFQVCALISGKEYCGKTDKDGKFLIDNIPAKSNSTISVRITDPNKGDLSKEMRYIFVDKHPFPINTNVSIKTDLSTTIGLAQGFLINPFSSNLGYKPYIITYTDLDLTMEKEKDWTGNTLYLDPATIGIVWDKAPKYRVYPNHQGSDWTMPMGTEVRATFPGTVIISDGGYPKDFARYVRTVVDIPDETSVYLITYGHNSENKKRVNDVVTYGETIALSGDDAGLKKSSPHLHMSIWRVPRAEIWNPYRSKPELYDYIFGRGQFAGNGNATRYANTDVPKEFCPFANYLFTGGQVPIYPDSPPK